MKVDTRKKHENMEVSGVVEKFEMIYNSAIERYCKTDCIQDPWCHLKDTKNKEKFTYWLFPDNSRHEKRKK